MTGVQTCALPISIGRTTEGDYYGSALRNLAGLVTTAAVAGQDAVVEAVFDRFSQLERMPDIDLTSTQEKAWMLLATNALGRRGGPLNLERGGQPVRLSGERAVFNPDAAALAAGFAVRNAAATPVWATVSVTGVPQEPFPPVEEGVHVDRAFFTLDGSPADLEKLRQNDRLVVSLSGHVDPALRRVREFHHELVILDLLPAGFEIEAVLARDENGKSIYDFLKPLSETAMREARDDRFVAAVNLPASNTQQLPYDEFHVAYVVRAITPGTYTLPAASVEDMYQPTVHARSVQRTVIIEAR